MPRKGDDQQSLGHFARLTGRHVLSRFEPFEQWRRAHAEQGHWGYHQEMLTAPGARPARVRDEYQREYAGINLLSQDYLGLSGHPALRQAITEALETYGPHSAGSPAAGGNTPLAGELCEETARLTAMRHVVLFPSGWAAGFGAVQALVGRHDHIVVDELAHSCLHQGAAASPTSRITRTPHLDNAAVRATLKNIRAHDSANGVLVITESLFSMDSDTPDLRGLQRICREYAATLLVDQSHDAGVLGPRGHGLAGAQGMLGQLDLVVGSFSKAFVSNCGYVATASPTVAQYLRYFASTHLFSSAPSPLQIAAALAAVRVATSAEGEQKREAMLANAHRLRSGLSASGRCAVLGSASPIVPLRVDSLAVARTALGIAEREGVLLHLVEFPIVPRYQARYRLSLNSLHTRADMDHAARVITGAIDEAARVHGHEG
ncbi:aminotransferase class I/II-fold pyridoxal phosphate-dependent enzyme [Streptomyces sp. NPDC127068]|uniref:aminotransferase class I/II-fold pyridoxal phosphate-dependent enzyme n=1 Tax=Streptomyces sp. NPDC127068 TaxID=3347127 RepID=UPI00365F975F